MKWLEMILVSLSLYFKILSFAIIAGVCVLAYCVSTGIKAGEHVTPFEIIILILVVFYFIWLSLKVSMFGDDLPKND